MKRDPTNKELEEWLKELGWYWVGGMWRSPYNKVLYSFRVAVEIQEAKQT